MKEIIKVMVEHIFYDLPNNTSSFCVTLTQLKNALLKNQENIDHNDFQQFAEIFKNPSMLGVIPNQLSLLTIGSIRSCLLDIMNELIQQHIDNTRVQIDLNIWNFEDIKIQLYDFLSDDTILDQQKNEYTTSVNLLNDEEDILSAVSEDNALGYNEMQLEGIQIGLSHEDVMNLNFGYHTLEAIRQMNQNGIKINDAAEIFRGLTFEEIIDKNIQIEKLGDS
ncbi:MAG: hypothetical protein EKK61_06505 [Rickettsiales bacterium]|nr:MAG: hypothetical protein EKK61_06505 [Rickettsiales bacterium]